MAQQRLDTLLVEQGLCPSRQQAQRLICAGEVKIAQQVIDKSGTLVASDAVIELKEKRHGSILADFGSHSQLKLSYRR